MSLKPAGQINPEKKGVFPSYFTPNIPKQTVWKVSYGPRLLRRCVTPFTRLVGALRDVHTLIHKDQFALLARLHALLRDRHL